MAKVHTDVEALYGIREAVIKLGDQMITAQQEFSRNFNQMSEQISDQIRQIDREMEATEQNPNAEGRTDSFWCSKCDGSIMLKVMGDKTHCRTAGCDGIAVRVYNDEKVMENKRRFEELDQKRKFLKNANDSLENYGAYISSLLNTNGATDGSGFNTEHFVYTLNLWLASLGDYNATQFVTESLNENDLKKNSNNEEIIPTAEKENSKVEQNKCFERPDKENTSETYNDIKNYMDRKKVSHIAISSCSEDRTSEEIVSSLSGGDKTGGSCSSLAFAYAGNVGGYNVLDFRGGKSRKFFASNGTISMIARLPGVESKIVNGKDDLDCADFLLSEMVPEKEYYFATGVHAAIVRLHNGRREYLELQHATKSGWHPLYLETLGNRFGCKINKIELPNFLIDVESLSTCDEFLDILGYINTEENRQKKGRTGHVR